LDETQSRFVVLVVTAHLRGLFGAALDEYVRQTYQVGSGELSTQTIYVSEVDRGNIPRGWLSSVPVRTWKVRGEECMLIPYVDMKPFNEASDQGKVWPHPYLTFYAELPAVLVSEKIGVAQDQKWRERQLICTRSISLQPGRTHQNSSVFTGIFCI